MERVSGKIAFGGIAIGKIREVTKEKNVVRRSHVDDVQAELSRFEKAREQAVTELQELYEKAVKEVGEANAAIFEVHRMMLRDSYYQETIENIIRSQGVNAEYAVGEHC